MYVHIYFYSLLENQISDRFAFRHSLFFYMLFKHIESQYFDRYQLYFYYNYLIISLFFL